MLALNASEVRKNWGGFIDNTVRVKPQFVKRSRDSIVALSINNFRDILNSYTFTAALYKEDDGSITASLDQIDLAVNGVDKNDALHKLASDLHEYAVDYYQEFDVWFSAKNRRPHFPYVMNVLSQPNLEEVRRLITCRDGAN